MYLLLTWDKDKVPLHVQCTSSKLTYVNNIIILFEPSLHVNKQSTKVLYTCIFNDTSTCWLICLEVGGGHVHGQGGPLVGKKSSTLA